VAHAFAYSRNREKQSALHSSRTDGVGPIFESEEKRLFPLRFPSFFVSLQKI
jgi:hypothetical protein